MLCLSPSLPVSTPLGFNYGLGLRVPWVGKLQVITRLYPIGSVVSYDDC